MALFPLLVLACATPPSAPEAPPESPPVIAPAAMVDDLDPQACYASVLARVEGEEAAGECAEDADCGTGGCSGEVCVAADKAREQAGACDVHPCFAALDVCTCQETRCRWQLRSSGAPPRSPPGP